MKELKRVSLPIVKRITEYLYNNPTLRTKAAMYCNMPYDRFMLYVDWMNKMGLLKIENKDNGVVLQC